MELTVEQISEFTQGSILRPLKNVQSKICGITWDSREVEPGCLYVALPGERVDGHDFAAGAIASGARAMLVSHELSEEALREADAVDAAIILVDDTFCAVTRLAAGWRSCLSATVVGLTGSCGKTTTKDLIAGVLSTAMSVTATKANQNNELGVPRTLLNASADDSAVVVEMGMRGSHQIDGLCAFVKPSIGVITNVGESHIELLGSRENIARAKGELIESLPSGGMAVLNAADDFTDFIIETTRPDERGVEVVLYDGAGTCLPQAKVFASDIRLDGDGHPSFLLHVFGSTAKCRLALRGLHNVINSCAAAAVAYRLGMSVDEIATALSSVEPSDGRQALHTTKAGVTIVDDAYNANPDSMRASLSTFAAMEVRGKRVAVLGDMGELGDYTEDGHRRVGTYAAGLVDCLICVGPNSRIMAQAACEAGASHVECVDDAEAALALVENELNTGDAVLVKASHSMDLTKVVEGLIA